MRGIAVDDISTVSQRCRPCGSAARGPCGTAHRRHGCDVQDNCKSADGNFNAECSAEQFAKLSLGNAAAVTARLENCTAALNNGDSSIPVADADVAGQAAQGVSAFQQATIVTAIPKPDRSHHYKGDLSAVRPARPTFPCSVPRCAASTLCASTPSPVRGRRVPHACGRAATQADIPEVDNRAHNNRVAGTYRRP